MSARVLVVDDEPLIADSVQAYLEDEGIEADSVTSAEEALARVGAACVYQVCIMDMRLPGMDGNAAIRALHGLCPRLRFIIHTGSADYVVPADLRAIGIANAHLFRKPLVDMGSIAATVRALVEG